MGKGYTVEAASKSQALENYIMSAVLAAFAVGVAWKFHWHAPWKIDHEISATDAMIGDKPPATGDDYNSPLTM